MTYGADLWGGYPPLWGVIYGAISPWYGVGCVLCMGLRRFAYGDLWGSCGCGLGPMGQTYGLLFTYGIAAVGLWGSMGLLWCMYILNSRGRTGCLWGLWGSTGAYGESIGCLWGVYGDLWGCMGASLLLWLWSRTCEESMGLYVSGMGSDVVYVWDCGARPMGIYGVALAAVWDPSD